jgi:hypothetical protein
MSDIAKYLLASLLGLVALVEPSFKFAVVVATSCAVGIVVSAVIADTDTPAEIPRVITTSNNAFRYERHIQK